MARNISIPMLNSPLLRSSSKPATFMSNTIEDELVAIFSRLDIYGMVLVDPRSSSDHQISEEGLDQAVRTMPVTFDTIKEASTYGNVVMTRSWHFVKIIQGLEKPPPWLPQEENQKQEWAGIEIRYGWNKWTGTDDEIPIRWLNEAEACAAECKHWFSAFEPLWLKLHREQGMFSRENMQATLLRLHAISTMLSVRGCLYMREIEWDVHSAEFQEMVTLSEIYLVSKPKQPYMTFEHETVVYLYYLLLKCRDGVVRRNALQLMEEYPRRDAFLNTKYTAVVGKWIMDTEKEELSGIHESYQISEERRMRVFGLDVDSTDGRIRTHGSLTINGELGFRSVTWP